MSVATVSTANQPLGEINTTPLIDVMLVLLIMIIMTIPISTHSLEYDLPRPGPVDTPAPDPIKNKLVVTGSGVVLWNGGSVSDGQLAALLLKVGGMQPEPEVQFEPAPNASYERSAQVLRIVRASRISRFGFVGNEKYREFARN